VATSWLFAVAATGPLVVGAVGALTRSGAVKVGAAKVGAVGFVCVLLTVTVGLAVVPVPPVESTEGAVAVPVMSPPVGLSLPVTVTRGWLEPLAVGAVLLLSPVTEGAMPTVNAGLVPVPVVGATVAVVPPPGLRRRAAGWTSRPVSAWNAPPLTPPVSVPVQTSPSRKPLRPH
jgi:hypothetical protein